MNTFIYDTSSINCVIQKTWKWPQLIVSIYLDESHLLDAAFFKIRNTWVSLPHQSNNGFRWNEDNVSKFIESKICIKKISLEKFNNRIFCLLNEALGNIKNSDKKNRKYVIQLSHKMFFSFMDNNSNTKTRFFIRSDRPLSPYFEAHKVISELKLLQCFKDQIGTFSSSVQRKIRKAKHNGIGVKIGSIKDLDVFYSLYRKRIHQLGSFGLPKIYFRNLLKKTNEAWLKPILAMYKGECIGVAILNIHSIYAENIYFATSKKHNYLYPSYALHAKMIELSIESKCEFYSLGRSTINSGVHRYKQQWGTKDKTVYYNYSWDKRNHLWIQKLASFLIPFLPLSFVKRFDYVISKRCY